MSAVNAAVAAAIAKAAERTNMNEAQKGGGGDYVPPAEGLCRLRFVAYIELGKHHDEKFNKTRDKVMLTFELSGPKHEAKKLEDGTLLPHRISITENLSLNEKANFYKLFRAMNYDGSATHIAQLLGNEFLGTVVHNKSKDGKRTYANLRGDSGYTIRKPYVEDPETGEVRKIPAAPQISETRCFLWDYADKAMWDSIFIDGEYEAEKNDAGEITRPARSKNVFQNQIKTAVNFPGSPIAEILENGALNLGDDAVTETPAADPAANPEQVSEAEGHDPLEGIQ